MMAFNGMYIGKNGYVAPNMSPLNEGIMDNNAHYDAQANAEETQAVVNAFFGGLVFEAPAALVNRMNMGQEGRAVGIGCGEAAQLIRKMLAVNIPRPQFDSCFVKPGDEPDDSELNFDEWCCQYLEGM